MLKEGYRAAGCCSPQISDQILGYFSHDNVIVVHKKVCMNLLKVEPARLIALSWDEIAGQEEYVPEEDYRQLEQLDFRILRHHQDMGIDYSLMVADTLGVQPDEIFERHKNLRNMKLLKRVQKVMIRYRKKIVENKWIKHRNHTYYEITPKGERYLDYFDSHRGKPK
jgi:hypothetical protein